MQSEFLVIGTKCGLLVGECHIVVVVNFNNIATLEQRSICINDFGQRQWNCVYVIQWTEKLFFSESNEIWKGNVWHGVVNLCTPKYKIINN
ncbi:hypothetical protein Lal_00019914 [Lupinus albus]|nr:hypothetical protein Lal_00019914 [Lupinus albus]